MAGLIDNNSTLHGEQLSKQLLYFVSVTLMVENSALQRKFDEMGEVISDEFLQIEDVRFLLCFLKSEASDVQVSKVILRLLSSITTIKLSFIAIQRFWIQSVPFHRSSSAEQQNSNCSVKFRKWLPLTFCRDDISCSLPVSVMLWLLTSYETYQHFFWDTSFPCFKISLLPICIVCHYKVNSHSYLHWGIHSRWQRYQPYRLA